MIYDARYNDIADYFGAEPEQLLVDHGHLLGSAGTVLDVGCGQGRNALYLARMGRTVLAIDPSVVAIETISRIAGDTKLPIEAHACGFEEYRTGADSLAGVLLFGIIQILEWEKIERLIEACSLWTQAGGLVFISAFSVEDPLCRLHAQTCDKIGKNSFVIEGADTAEREIRTYLEPDEILRLFRAWEIIHHWEGLGPEHRHGSGPPERHGRIEAVLRKRE